MKKELIILSFAFLLSLSFVFAVQGNGNQIQNQNSYPLNSANLSGIGQELREQIQTRKQEFKAGNYTVQGRFMNVSEIVSGLKEMRMNRTRVRTHANLSIEYAENETKIKMQLRNGTEKEIKIMPDTASERALERLRIKVCNESNNCTIELKEVGKDNQTQTKYEMQVQRHYKILGLFQAKAENKAEVNAETGEGIITKKPWWSFLATRQEQ